MTEPVRAIVEIDSLVELEAAKVEKPSRLVIMGPRRGGPTVAQVRKILSPGGRVRFSGTSARIFADLDPGEPEQPIIGLDMIARSDARGLERALLSALPHADEIIIGIDGRSDEETRIVAEAYADAVWTFTAADIGLSDDDWKADKIHFANARNLGRGRIAAPWCLVIDSDEYIAQCQSDLRQRARDAGETAAFAPTVTTGEAEHQDRQRLSLTKFRWVMDTHNLLLMDKLGYIELPDCVIVQDLSLRAKDEVDRRNGQRNTAVIDGLAEEADKGNLNALFHLAKHKLGIHDEDGVRLAQDYRFRAEVHGPLAPQRAWLAIGSSFLYYEKEDFANAELWALRAMLDGPRIEAACVMGDIAEDQGDLDLALRWYEVACATRENDGLRWRALTELRWGRLAGIRRALGLPITGEPIRSPRREGMLVDRLNQ